MMGIGKRKERMGRFLEGERKDIYIYIYRKWDIGGNGNLCSYGEIL